MKKVIFLVCAIFLIANVVYAGTGTVANLVWDPVTQCTDNSACTPLEYRVYQSGTSGSYTTPSVCTAPTPSCTINSLFDGTWFWTVTAYNTVLGESGKSNEVSKIIDNTLPILSVFTIPVTASSLTVAITNFMASDINGIAGYIVMTTEEPPLVTNAGWSATKPTTFTFTSPGPKTLFAWVKDPYGNISISKNASVVITLPVLKAPIGLRLQ